MDGFRDKGERGGKTRCEIQDVDLEVGEYWKEVQKMGEILKYFLKVKAM